MFGLNFIAQKTEMSWAESNRDALMKIMRFLTQIIDIFVSWMCAQAVENCEFCAVLQARDSEI